MPASRRPLISGNWKMHQTHHEAIHLTQKLSYLLGRDTVEKVDVSIHPPFTDIRSVQTTLESDRIPFFLGAQNCHPEIKGAFTGEISPLFLQKLNVAYVIVGHSERRSLFGETDDFVARKAIAVANHEMTPIVCVGETKDQREAGEAGAVVESQVRGSLKGLSVERVGALVIAYEPVWAIGTGLTATAQDAQEICALIRGVVRSDWGSSAADSVRIQYGGSVKAGNVAEIMAQPDIDGALVGGASLDPDEFARIVQFEQLSR
jgi:triosephosphate isomerase